MKYRAAARQGKADAEAQEAVGDDELAAVALAQNERLVRRTPELRKPGLIQASSEKGEVSSEDKEDISTACWLVGLKVKAPATTPWSKPDPVLQGAGVVIEHVGGVAFAGPGGDGVGRRAGRRAGGGAFAGGAGQVDGVDFAGQQSTVVKADFVNLAARRKVLSRETAGGDQTPECPRRRTNPLRPPSRPRYGRAHHSYRA